jgi:hypothetical protein
MKGTTPFSGIFQCLVLLQFVVFGGVEKGKSEFEFFLWTHLYPIGGRF